MSKMRWDCRKGCYLSTLHPPIHEFDHCFPGRVAMGNLDGVVERHGRILFLEWKTHGHPIGVGQRITFEALSSKPGQIVYVVVGPTQGLSDSTGLDVILFKDGKASPSDRMSKAELDAEFATWWRLT